MHSETTCETQLTLGAQRVGDEEQAAWIEWCRARWLAGTHTCTWKVCQLCSASLAHLFSSAAKRASISCRHWQNAGGRLLGQPCDAVGKPTTRPCSPTAHGAHIGNAVLGAVCRLLQPRQCAGRLGLHKEQVLRLVGAGGREGQNKRGGRCRLESASMERYLPTLNCPATTFSMACVMAS